MKLPLTENLDGQIIPPLCPFIRVLNELNVVTFNRPVGGVSLIHVVNEIGICHITVDEIV